MMYKQIGFLLIVLVGVTTVDLSTSSNSKTLRLENMHALQAAAGEISCEPVSENICQMLIREGSIIGTGQPTYHY